MWMLLKQRPSQQLLPFYDDWLATPQADLDKALIVATRWLETLNYKGERCTDHTAFEVATAGC